MRHKLLFGLALLGILIGLVSAYLYGRQAHPQPPLTTNSDPYVRGIFANGIIESYDAVGENINIYPEVAGRVTTVYVTDGTMVRKGEPLFALYDRIQQQIVAQDLAQANAARALLDKLKAEPRPQTLTVSRRQVDYARANLVYQEAQLKIIRRERALNAQAVSLLALKNAINSVRVAEENLRVAQAQYDLTKAGAWIYDIQNEQAIYEAAQKTYASNEALLGEYIIRAPVTGRILRINVTKGSYASPQGVYGTYSQGMNPAAVMGRRSTYMQVRAYLDEILVPRLPPVSELKATLFIRGMTNKSIPLQFVRIQPYITPKIELSNQRTEKVDVRVLPIIFRFKIPPHAAIYPGELVDVYISGNGGR